MALEAEALLLVAALALDRRHARLDRVHRDVVARVDRVGAHFAVVAVGAVVLAVAVRAELRVVPGDLAVAEDPVGTVLGVVEPAGGVHLAADERRPHARVAADGSRVWVASVATWQTRQSLLAVPRAAESAIWWQAKQPRMRGS